jgi:dihydrofolate reductase
MGDILVHEFITVDGVVESPSWTMEYGFDPKMGESIARVMGSTGGLLLGRKTYEMFAPAWSGRTADEDPGAPFMNESPKYVVTSTLDTVDWNNSSILGPYDPQAIRALKERTDAGLYVSGSVRLVRAMLADGLVDQLHLFVYPLALGSGLKLFADGQPTSKFSLGTSEVYDNGVVHLDYRPAV